MFSLMLQLPTQVYSSIVYMSAIKGKAVLGLVQTIKTHILWSVYKNTPLMCIQLSNVIPRKTKAIFIKYRNHSTRNSRFIHP